MSIACAATQAGTWRAAAMRSSPPHPPPPRQGMPSVWRRGSWAASATSRPSPRRRTCPSPPAAAPTSS
eukprot:13329477-Heterocapsa_arctica.AAC.1